MSRSSFEEAVANGSAAFDKNRKALDAVVGITASCDGEMLPVPRR